MFSAFTIWKIQGTTLVKQDLIILAIISVIVFEKQFVITWNKTS